MMTLIRGILGHIMKQERWLRVRSMQRIIGYISTTLEMLTFGAAVAALLDRTLHTRRGRTDGGISLREISCTNYQSMRQCREVDATTQKDTKRYQNLNLCFFVVVRG
mmetsp:Transcript_28242/g.56827  ORF Transcript_28242/g.56827 Transcript_28242/m.56827 type:complete len:107 (+) Transcript_28242:1264-1584(+)